MTSGWLAPGWYNEHCDEVWILVPPAASQQPPALDPDQAAGLKISIVMPTYRRSHTLFLRELRVNSFLTPPVCIEYRYSVH